MRVCGRPTHARRRGRVARIRRAVPDREETSAAVWLGPQTARAGPGAGLVGLYADGVVDARCADGYGFPAAGAAAGSRGAVGAGKAAGAAAPVLARASP